MRGQYQILTEKYAQIRKEHSVGDDNERGIDGYWIRTNRFGSGSNIQHVVDKILKAANDLGLTVCDTEPGELYFQSDPNDTSLDHPEARVNLLIQKTAGNLINWHGGWYLDGKDVGERRYKEWAEHQKASKQTGFQTDI